MTRQNITGRALKPWMQTKNSDAAAKSVKNKTNTLVDLLVFKAGILFLSCL